MTNGLARIAERRFPALGKDDQRAALESVLRAAGIDPRLQPERIEPEAWLALARAFEIASPGTPPEARVRAGGPVEVAAEAEGGDGA